MENKEDITLNQSDIDGVEKEDINGEMDADVITKPFKPDDIDVDIATVNLGSVIEQLENEEIELQPDFQRATDVWDP